MREKFCSNFFFLILVHVQKTLRNELISFLKGGKKKIYVIKQLSQRAKKIVDDFFEKYFQYNLVNNSVSPYQYAEKKFSQLFPRSEGKKSSLSGDCC